MSAILRNLEAHSNWLETLFLYLLVILFVTMFSNLSILPLSWKNRKSTTSFHFSFFIISFLILWVIAVFGDVGTDAPVYKRLFIASYDFKKITHGINTLEFAGIEKGYVFFNTIIRHFTTNNTIYLGVFYFVLLGCIFLSVFKLKNKISIPIALFSYVCIFYFQSFSLYRIYLASALILLAFTFLYAKKNICYLGLVLIAASIHYSAIFFLVPFMVFIISQNEKKFLWSICLIVLVFSIIAIKPQFVLSVFSNNERYDTYFSLQNMRGSLSQMFFSLPIFIIYIIIKKNIDKEDEKNLRMWKLLIIFSLALFGLAILSYFLPFLGRMAYYNTMSYMLFLAFSIKIARNNNNKLLYYCLLIFIMTFCLFRFYFYFSGEGYIDGIIPYNLIF